MFNNTVDSILSSINKKIDKLYDLAAREGTKATAKQAVANDLIGQAKAHNEEASRAVRIAQRFQEFVR